MIFITTKSITILFTTSKKDLSDCGKQKTKGECACVRVRENAIIIAFISPLQSTQIDTNWT